MLRDYQAYCHTVPVFAHEIFSKFVTYWEMFFFLEHEGELRAIILRMEMVFLILLMHIMGKVHLICC